MTPNRAIAVVAAALAMGVAPPPDLKPSVWAAEHLVVTDGPKAGQKWDVEETPQLAEIIDHMSPTAPANEVVVRKSAQTGYTQGAEAVMGFIIDVAPAPTMVVMPTVNAAQDFNRDKLSPAIEASRPLRAKVRRQVSRSSSGSTALNKRFPGGNIVITGANSAADLRSKTIKIGIGDEIDEWPQDLDNQGDPLAMLAARQISYDAAGDWKRLLGSTPTIKGASRIDAKFEASDQRYAQVPCPHCNEYQRLYFFPDDEGKGGLRFNKEYPYEAHYSCRHCGMDIFEHHKQAMIRPGVIRWVPENPGPGRQPGYHLDVMTSKLVTWERVAEEFLKAKDDPLKLKAFYNLWLGLAWEERGDAPEWQRLFARREDYAQGSVPVGGLILTLGVDVQGDGLFYEVVAWGPGWESWTVEAGFLPGDTADPASTPWRMLDEVQEREYPNAHGGTMRIALTGVDSQFNTGAVHEWTRRKGRAVALPLRGMPGWGLPPMGTPARVDVKQSGKKKRRGLRQWPVGTWTVKGLFYGFLRKPGLREGESQDPPGYCHFGTFLDERYFQQLTAEYIKHREMKNGRRIPEWHARGENHFHDCRVYNMALAHKLGVGTMTTDDWARLAAAHGAPPSAPQGDLLDPVEMVGSNRAPGRGSPPATAAKAPGTAVKAPAKRDYSGFL